MKCGGMRASTLGCRFLDSCGDSLGVRGAVVSSQFSTYAKYSAPPLCERCTRYSVYVRGKYIRSRVLPIITKIAFV